MHLCMCTFGSTQCAGLFRCILNVLRLRGFRVPPRDSFTGLLRQSQISRPWAHSQLAYCKLSSKRLGWMVQLLLTYSSSTGPGHQRHKGRMVHNLQNVTVRTLGNLLHKHPHKARQEEVKSWTRMAHPTFTVENAKHVFLIIRTSTTRD